MTLPFALHDGAHRTTASPGGLTTSARLRELARCAPRRTALRVGDRRVDYGELDASADALAAALLADLGPGSQCIGLQCNDTLEMFLGSLGIARAGKTSVPLDPTAPAERASLVLASVGAPLVLSDLDTEVPGVPRARPSEHRAPVRPGGVDVAAAPVASIVFSSGSTGVPKGIVIPARHRADLRRSSIFSVVGQIYEGDVVGSLAAGTVGFSETLVHAAVHLGVSVDAYEIRRLGLVPLAAWLDDSPARGFVTVPTVLRFFLPTLDPKHVFPHLEAVILTGETATWEDVRELWPHLRAGGRVYNFFGLTETDAVAALEIAEIPAEASGPLPAGTPLPGVRVVVVDPDGEPLPDGERGEIVVESPRCATGYWHEPELSAQVFTELAGGVSRVRTGDAGRFRPDGVLEHLGRLDHVVKISGNRVDLGDVEANLRALPGIAAAAASTYEDQAGHTRLVAFAVVKPGAPAHPRELRAALATRLPAPLLPDRIELVESLPQLPNGKVDRRALHDASSAPRPEPPLDAGQETLTGQITVLMRRVTGDGALGPDDDFFAAGGDSLRAAQLFADLESDLGIVRPFSLLLEAPTPRRLAAAVEAGTEEIGLLVPVAGAGGAGPALFVVHDGSGEVYYARPLAAALELAIGSSLPVYGLRSPLLLGDRSCSSIEQLAARYVGEIRRVQPAGPYLLYGHSLGGLIAFEMARRLQADGAEVVLLGLGDAPAPRAPIGWRAAGRLRELSRQTPRGALRMAAHFARAQAASLVARATTDRRSAEPAPSLEELFPRGTERERRMLVEHGTMMLGYAPGTPFVGRPLLVRAGGPMQRPDRGWGAFSTGGVTICDVDVDHATLGRERAAALAASVLAGAITAALGAVSGGAVSGAAGGAPGRAAPTEGM